MRWLAITCATCAACAGPPRPAPALPSATAPANAPPVAPTSTVEGASVRISNPPVTFGHAETYWSSEVLTLRLRGDDTEPTRVTLRFRIDPATSGISGFRANVVGATVGASTCQVDGDSYAYTIPGPPPPEGVPFDLGLELVVVHCTGRWHVLGSLPIQGTLRTTFLSGPPPS